MENQARCEEAKMNALFRPSVAALESAAGVLDRSVFTKTVPLAAAVVHENRNIARYRRELEQAKELLDVERLASVVPHPDQSLAAQGRKCLLLRPSVKATVEDSWGAVLKQGVSRSDLAVVPFELKLDYQYFTYADVMSAILPASLHDEIPTGFNVAGHVAHLNLREPYLPYKKLIGEVLVDKNAHIRTVINKVDNVGTESVFRTFSYEVLAGPDDMEVEVRENECTFHFDYSKVYWNSKLEAEHSRLIRVFEPGEVVCDVMAGIGPFAIPAGRKGVFVWANDMNPESYRYLKEAIVRNKVSPYIRPFNVDGRQFIRMAADLVYTASANGDHAVSQAKTRRHVQNDATRRRPAPQKIAVPPTISHFVMNLPASATTFVHHYRGVYAGKEKLFTPHTRTRLPLVHVHCFALKSEGEEPRLDICQRLSHELGMEMVPGDADKAGEVAIHCVRDVAPAKSMFCASFRLPERVAFAARDLDG